MTDPLPSPNTASEVARQYADIGSQLLAEEKYEAAAQAFSQVITLSPGDIKCRLRLLNALRPLGRRAEAESVLREILAISDEHEYAHGELGSMLLEQERFAEAALHLKRAYDLAYSKALLLGKRWEAIVPAEFTLKKKCLALERTLNMDSGLATGLFLLAQALSEMGIGPKTIQTWSEHFLSAQRTVAEFVWFGEHLISLGMFSEAEHVLCHARSQYPADLSILLVLAKAKANLPFTFDVVELWEQILQQKPQRAEYLHAYGSALLTVGRLDEARRCLELAYEREPGKREYALAFLNSLEIMGDTEAAIAVRRRLTLMEPENMSAALAHVDGLLATQDPQHHEEAERLTLKLTELAPDDPWVDVTLQRLASKSPHLFNIINVTDSAGTSAIPKRLRFSGELVCFLHIPRTGGTSLKRYLTQLFGESRCASMSNISSHREIVASLRAHANHGVIDIRCLSGHMLYGIHDYVETPVRYVTILRDPVKRVVSEYVYGFNPLSWFAYSANRGLASQRRVAFSPGNLPIRAETYFTRRNTQTKILAGVPLDFNPSAEDGSDELALARAIHHLKTLDVVCTTDRLGTLPGILNKKFGWNVHEMPEENTTGSAAYGRGFKSIEEAIATANQLDVKLYRVATELLDSTTPRP